MLGRVHEDSRLLLLTWNFQNENYCSRAHAYQTPTPAVTRLLVTFEILYVGATVRSHRTSAQPQTEKLLVGVITQTYSCGRFSRQHRLAISVHVWGNADPDLKLLVIIGCFTPARAGREQEGGVGCVWSATRPWYTSNSRNQTWNTFTDRDSVMWCTRNRAHQ